MLSTKCRTAIKKAYPVGSLHMWGFNTAGSLGLFGYGTSVLSPTYAYPAGFVEISIGGSFNFGIKSDGTLWSWGKNDTGVLGQGHLNHVHSPTQVGTDNDWAQVSCGFSHTMALKQDGSLWGCGPNFWGQLGTGENGNETSKNILTRVIDNDPWKYVGTPGGGNSSLAIKADGTMWGWGSNSWGRLGIGVSETSTTLPRDTPIQIGTQNDWKKVVGGGFFGLALKEDGSLWSWGFNSAGQLGRGNTTNTASPVRVGTANDWKEIAVGSEHVVAIKTNGTVFSWGAWSNGRLGIQSASSNVLSPTQIGTHTDWRQVDAGLNHSFLIKEDGSLWAFGSGERGKTGFGHTNNVTTPTRVGTDLWSFVSTGRDHSGAIKGGL